MNVIRTSLPEWTEQHNREAVAFVYAVASKLAREGHDYLRAGEAASRAGKSEEWFRIVLSYLDGFGQNAAIEVAVTRVDDLATGRLVRDTWTVWRVRDQDGTVRIDELVRGEAEAFAAGPPTCKLSRVTRTTLRRR